MLGSSFLLSDQTIVELCALASSLSSVDDLGAMVTLRAEPRSRLQLFRVILGVVSCAPPPKRKRSTML